LGGVNLNGLNPNEPLELDEPPKPKFWLEDPEKLLKPDGVKVRDGSPEDEAIPHSSLFLAV